MATDASTRRPATSRLAPSSADWPLLRLVAVLAEIARASGDTAEPAAVHREGTKRQAGA